MNHILVPQSISIVQSWVSSKLSTCMPFLPRNFELNILSQFNYLMRKSAYTEKGKKSVSLFSVSIVSDAIWTKASKKGQLFPKLCTFT
jgi:hypothetical protein